jgi:hypothetical protein
LASSKRGSICFFKVFLRIDVDLGRYHAYFAAFHPHSLQKCAHPLRATLDSGQLLDRRHRLLGAGGRMLAKIGFEHGAVIFQITARTSESQLFQSLDPAPLIVAHILGQRRRAHIRQPTNILVRQSLAFQPKRFHLALNNRVRMIVTFVTQRRLVLIAEFDLDHR